MVLSIVDSTIAHIPMNNTNNNDVLNHRWTVLRSLREFFWSQKFIEVETPIVVRLPGQEPYLNPVPVTLHDEQNQSHQFYLHTSPEYAMKKLLASGYEKIFTITKAFRDYESFGGLHQPEFSMIEWYRTNATMHDLMDDIEGLLHRLSESSLKKITSVERVSMADLWKQTIDVSLDRYLTQESMCALCVEKGYTPAADESYDDLFYRIFLNEIEPTLQERGTVLVHTYPAPMAALAKLTPDKQYAERCELYINGIEIANGFSELTDPAEQRTRFVAEQAERRKLGKVVYPIDEELLEALDTIDTAAGIALGIDRLVMALTGAKTIEEVLT